ncbi:SET domain-containing protein [Nonomuraea sp. NPDC049784]|uniref:SET domain-containing protein n=1 Tax=Nonomuraea sp. NPDC049784 TaxID=3154361 RepID=UPI0033F0B146
MVEDPEPDCRLHPNLEVGPSPVSGDGLFATAAIPAGTVIARLGGTLVTWERLQELFDDPAVPYVDTIDAYGDLHLVLPLGQPIGKSNHSCDPNLWWVGPYTLAARRDLGAGEEVTNDYATSTAAPGFSMECRCGTALCRGRVSGADWRRPELQERYGDHWVPALLDLINGDRSSRRASG